MEDFIGVVTMCTFAAVGVGFTLYVVVRSIINLARATDGHGTIVLKALTVLGVWGLISLTFIFIPIMLVFEPGRGVDRDTANHRVTIVTIVLTLIYIAVGLALGYWVRLQPGWKTLRKAQTEA
jgi:hypothetical protein